MRFWKAICALSAVCIFLGLASNANAQFLFSDIIQKEIQKAIERAQRAADRVDPTRKHKQYIAGVCRKTKGLQTVELAEACCREVEMCDGAAPDEEAEIEDPQRECRDLSRTDDIMADTIDVFTKLIFMENTLTGVYISKQRKGIAAEKAKQEEAKSTLITKYGKLRTCLASKKVSPLPDPNSFETVVDEKIGQLCESQYKTYLKALGKFQGYAEAQLKIAEEFGKLRVQGWARKAEYNTLITNVAESRKVVSDRLKERCPNGRPAPLPTVTPSPTPRGPICVGTGAPTNAIRIRRNLIKCATQGLITRGEWVELDGSDCSYRCVERTEMCDNSDTFIEEVCQYQK